MHSVGTSEFLENAEDILSFVKNCQDASIPCALCVVTGVTGGSARAVGTLVAVRADGQMAGYVSHGCVDADLCLQAQKSMENGCTTSLVYGVGSPFMDLQLPCGGTVEILIDPTPDVDICMKNLSQSTDRNHISLAFHPKNGLVETPNSDAPTGWVEDVFFAHHRPALRLHVAGSGPALAAVVKMGTAIGLQVWVYSPDENAERFLGPENQQIKHRHLRTAADSADLKLDPWCAVLLLFHDHAWEPSILKAALDSDAFYIGALGSAKTHEKRLKTLRSEGVNSHQLARINGPIGVIAAARDAHTLAISALAEILDAYRASPKS